MIDEIKKLDKVLEKEIDYNTITTSNSITGDKDHIYPKLKQSFKTSTTIDIIVSFLMESRVKLLLQDLKEALNRGVKIRILTGNYLKITQPQALYLLKSELKDKVDLRFYNNTNKSFHPKAYISSIEWNYRFLKSTAPNDFKVFYDTFEDLFNNHSLIITDEVLKDYSKQWTRPNIYKDIEKEESKEDNGIYDETVNYEDIDYKNGKYDDKQLEEALMLNKRGEVILNHYLKYNSKRAIGFCTSRHHAEYMAKVFNENNIPSAAVYSGEKGEYSEERNIALSKLTSGEVKVIFSVYMFNEGLDVPAIDMVMFLRPTQSPTIFLQQLGING